jgi:hypothetical protein
MKFISSENTRKCNNWKQREQQKGSLQIMTIATQEETPKIIWPDLENETWNGTLNSSLNLYGGEQKRALSKDKLS